MLRQRIKFTPIQWVLVGVVCTAAVGAGYYFRHYRKVPAVGQLGELQLKAEVVGRSIASIEGETSDDAARERFLALLTAFANRHDLTIEIMRFRHLNYPSYIIRMWRGATIIIGGNEVAPPSERFELGLVQDDPEPGKVALAKALMEELRREIGQLPGVVLQDTK